MYQGWMRLYLFGTVVNSGVMLSKGCPCPPETNTGVVPGGSPFSRNLNLIVNHYFSQSTVNHQCRTSSTFLLGSAFKRARNLELVWGPKQVQLRLYVSVVSSVVLLDQFRTMLRETRVKTWPRRSQDSIKRSTKS